MFKQVWGEASSVLFFPKLEVIAEIPSPEQKELAESKALDEESTPPVSDPSEAEVADEGVARVDPSPEQTQAVPPDALQRSRH